MLPFLKNRQEGSASSPVETVERSPDEASDYGMLDAVADDLFAAIERKDKKLFKSAIEALAEHLKDEDEEQDNAMKGQ